LTLNLKNEAGREVLLRLMRDCDVYITNQPLPMRRSLQLMPEDLMPQNPRMIYASLTAYGEQGPDADRESFDLVAYWSRSGLMNQMRHKGVEPIQAMAGMGDHPTGMSLYANIVTALLKRERTGEGSLVHTSLLANGIWSASCFAQSSWAAGDFSPIPGQRVTTALYEASDERWLQFSMIRTEEMFDRLLLALDKTEWLLDERFASVESRLAHAPELTQLLREVITQRSSSEWMAVFQANDVPAARVAEFHDLPLDEQVLANDMAMPPAVDLGMERVIRAPINVSGVAHRPAEPAPEMGEHNDAILAEMGYSAQEIANFKREGIV
jgi:crotonobetainyl-CoA:carnitine CoA-transferase CaiB-like acyl-CoA transferase